MARFSRPRAGGRFVASALAREHQVSSVCAARKRSLSRNIVVAPSVQEDAWSRAVEWVKFPLPTLLLPSRVHRVFLQVVAPR